MTIQQQWTPQIDNVRCTGCGDCIVLCPTGALGEIGGKAVVVRPQTCTYCAICEDVCPTNAIGLPYQIIFSQDHPDSKGERY
ncbi:ATP-binding protein [Aggregatilinea lenta]|uniref:ATP-binding protein n=1 Tax=Aggregatilinea lenta TaxID=913108 RepID=UPI000E5AB84A